MSGRSPESQALHDGFEQHVLPVLEPLGFVVAPVPREARAAGWTVLAAECTLPSGARLRAELACLGASSLRFQLTGPKGAVELVCTESDPAYPKRPSVSTAMASFEALGDAREGGERLAARRRLALAFLAAEIAATSDQLVAAVPDLASRVEAARATAAWRGAAERARVLWERRNVRSDVEERAVEGTFGFVGEGLVVVVAEGRRFTFRFDTARIDRKRRPIVSGWWRTAAGTEQPSELVVGDVRLRFDASGKLVPE